MPYKNARKKVARRVPRRRLQSYTPKQKEQILRNAAASIAGGYASLRRRSFTPATASSYMKNKKKSSSSDSSSWYPRGTADQGLADYKKSTATYGRRAPLGKLVKKATYQTLNTQVYSIFNYGKWNRGQGNLMVRSNQPGALGTLLVQPLHLWELTAINQGSGASVNYPAAFYECQFTNETATGQVTWLTNVNNSTTTATGLDQFAGLYNPGFNPHLTYSSQPSYLIDQTFEGQADDILEKVKCTMVLNGPTQRSTKWCIQLVQLSEEVTPGIENASSNEATAFWQAMCRPYGFSPLETGPRGELKKNIKYLKTVEYIMDSPESNEDHLTARMRHIDFTMYFNRKQKYRWGRVNDLTNMSTADIPLDTVGAFSTKPEPKARIYLMIRALSSQTGPSVAPTNTVFPSYDIKLDMTHKKSD
jgi:hypothetical protein